MSAATGRIRELRHRFHLPTVGAEAEPRFVAAGQATALPTLAEVLELEAEDRRAATHRAAALRLEAAARQDRGHLRRGTAAAPLHISSLSLRAATSSSTQQRARLRPARHGQDARRLRARTRAGRGRPRRALHAAYQLVQELLAAKRDLALPRRFASSISSSS